MVWGSIIIINNIINNIIIIIIKLTEFNDSLVKTWTAVF